jgi:hypothetical protein
MKRTMLKAKNIGMCNHINICRPITSTLVEGVVHGIRENLRKPLVPFPINYLIPHNALTSNSEIPTIKHKQKTL